jgi:hypothetical protein
MRCPLEAAMNSTSKSSPFFARFSPAQKIEGACSESGDYE